MISADELKIAGFDDKEIASHQKRTTLKEAGFNNIEIDNYFNKTIDTDPHLYGIPEGAGEPISTITGQPLTTEFGKPKEPDIFEGLTPDKLGFMDKWREIKKEGVVPFVPFLSGAKEVKDIAQVASSAYRLDKDAATPEDEERLISFVQEANKDTDFWYKTLDTVSQMPAFMGEFILTGGIYAAGRKTGTKVATKSVKKLLGKSGERLLKKKIGKVGVKVAAGVAGATLQAPVMGAFRIASGTIERSMPKLQLTENERSEIDILIAGEGEDLLPAFTKALGDQWAETVSEHSGGLFGILGRSAKNAAIRTGLFSAFMKANPKVSVNKAVSFFKKMGYHGVISEMLEERLGEGLRAGLGVQEYQLPTIEQLGVELVSFSVPGVVQGIGARAFKEKPGLTPEPIPTKAKAGLDQEAMLNNIKADLESGEITADDVINFATTPEAQEAGIVDDLNTLALESLSPEDLDNFREKYPDLRPIVNGIISEKVKSEINKEMEDADARGILLGEDKDITAKELLTGKREKALTPEELITERAKVFEGTPQSSAEISAEVFEKEITEEERVRARAEIEPLINRFMRRAKPEEAEGVTPSVWKSQDIITLANAWNKIWAAGTTVVPDDMLTKAKTMAKARPDLLALVRNIEGGVEMMTPEEAEPTAEVAREPVGVEIPEFKNTGDALTFGKKATPEQKKLLKQRQEASLKRFEELKDTEDFDAMMIEATKAQLDREALEAEKIIAEHPEFDPDFVAAEKIEKAEFKESWEITLGESVDQRKEKAIKSGVEIDEITEDQIKMWEQAHIEEIVNSPRDTDISAKILASLPETTRESMLRTHPIAASNWVDTFKIWNKPYREILADVRVRAGIGKVKKMHRDAVEKAIKANKPVPKEVLAEYPDLKPLPPKLPEAKPSEAVREDIKGEVIPEVTPKRPKVEVGNKFYVPENKSNIEITKDYGKGTPKEDYPGTYRMDMSGWIEVKDLETGDKFPITRNDLIEIGIEGREAKPKPEKEKTEVTPEKKELWEMSKEKFFKEAINVNIEDFKNIPSSTVGKSYLDYILDVTKGEKPSKATKEPITLAMKKGKIIVTDGEHRVAEAYRAGVTVLKGKWLNKKEAEKYHAINIQQAVKEGKTIPPEVLKDYPDLKVEEKVEVETTPEGKEISVDLTKKEEAAVTPKQQKEYLLAEIDKAIETELKTEGFGKGIEDAKELLKRRINPLIQSKTTYKFEVPNDGTFEIAGSVLFEFQDRVKSAFPATIISKKFKPRVEAKKAVPTAKYNKIIVVPAKDLKPADIDRIFKEVADTEARDITGAVLLNPFQNWLLSQDITKAVEDKIRSVAGRDYIEEARVKIEKQDLGYAKSMVEYRQETMAELQGYYDSYKAKKLTLKQIEKETGVKRSGHDLRNELQNAKYAYAEAVRHLEKLEGEKKFATKATKPQDKYAIEPPKLNPKEISNLARGLDYRGHTEAIKILKAKGIKSIDGYYITQVDDKDYIAKHGIETGAGWYGREESVYFFADPDDIKQAIPYLAMKIEGDKGGDVLVVHFNIPIENIKDMEWDGFFASQFEAYSSFRIKKDISKKQLADFKLFTIPSDKDWAAKYSAKSIKPQDTITRADLKSIFGKMKNISTGVDKDGNFFFRPFGKPVVTIYEVNHIEGYIDTSKGRIPVGSFLGNTIELKTGGEGHTADIGTAWHEYEHWMEANGILSNNDIKALDQAIGKAVVTEEDRATYVGDSLSEWQGQKNLRIKRVLKKIADFVNAIYEFVSRTRTARGVLADIETGRLIGKEAVSERAGALISAYQMAGVSAIGAPTGQLVKAQEMLAEGKDKKEVWRETGWLKGAEGKWRFEIDDSGATLNDKVLADAFKIPLANVLEHPELYKAYPELKKTLITVFAPKTNQDPQGFLDNDENIFLNIEHLTNAKEIILHEVQHSIQFIENFAKGGSFIDAIEYSNTEALKLNKELFREITKKREKFIQEKRDEGDNREVYAINDEFWGIEENAEEQARLRKIYYAKLKSISKDKGYTKLAGEIEARDTAARAKLTPEQRREQMPYEAEGIPREDWIITKGEGTSFSVEENAIATLRETGVEIDSDGICTVYRGGDVSETKLRKLRYGDFLSAVKEGKDLTGNSGAAEYGKNVVTLKILAQDLKITNGELQYIGESYSLEGGKKYPQAIYKAYNDYYGSNYTAKEIDEQTNVREVASMGLRGGREEFDALMAGKETKQFATKPTKDYRAMFRKYQEAGIKKPSEKLDEIGILEKEIQDLRKEFKQDIKVTPIKELVQEATGKLRLSDIIKEARIITRKTYEAIAKRKKGIALLKLKERYRNSLIKAKARKEASARVNKIIKGLKKIDTEKMSPPQAKAINTILQDIDLTKLSSKKRLRLEKTKRYLDGNPDAEMPSYVLKDLERLSKKSIRDLTLDEFESLNIAVLHHAHLDKVKQTIRVGREMRRSQQTLDDSLMEMKPAKKVKGNIVSSQAGKLGKLKRTGRLIADTFGIRHDHFDLIIESLAGQNSTMDKVLYQGVKEGITEELKYKQNTFKKFQDDLGDFNKKHKIKDITKWLNETVKTGKFELTRGERTALYRHSLNPDNKKAIIEGGFGFKFSEKPNKVHRITKDEFNSIIDSLADAEKDFAGKPLDNLFADQVEKLDKIFLEKNGYALPREENYYPKDTMPLARAIDVEVEDAFELFKGKWLRVGVSKGMLEKRKRVALPIYLNSITHDINKSVAKSSAYIGLEIPLSNASKLLYNPTFRLNLSNKYGEQVWKEIEKGLRDIAGEYQTYTITEKLLIKAKNRLAVAMLGVNPFVMAKQVLSLPVYLPYVKSRYLSLGTIDSIWNPEQVLTRHKLYSPELLERIEGGYSRDVADVFKAGAEKRIYAGQKSIKEKFMGGIKLFDKMAVMAGTQGAVLQTLDEFKTGKLSREVGIALDMKDSDIAGLTPEQKMKLAYKFADYATQRTQPMFSPEHRSSLSRGSAVEKLATMFGSFTNQALNLTRRSYREAIRTGDKQAYAKFAKSLMVIFVINTMGVMAIDDLRDRLYGRDERPLWGRILSSWSAYMFFVRDLASSVVSKIERGTFLGYDVSLPISRIPELLSNSIANGVNTLTEKDIKKRKKAAINFIDDSLELSMMLYGIPYATPKKLAARAVLGAPDVDSKEVKDFKENLKEINVIDKNYNELLKKDRTKAFKYDAKTNRIRRLKASFSETSSQLGEQRKRKERIMSSKAYTSDQKRKLIDNINTRMTRIAKSQNKVLSEHRR